MPVCGIVKLLQRESPVSESGVPRRRLVADLCVDSGHAFEGGKGLDGFSGFLLGDTQIVEALEIDPKFGGGAEKMRQAQRRVRRDVALSIQDLGDTIGGNLQLTRQRGGAHVEFLQFLGQMFSGMNGNHWHIHSFRRSNSTDNAPLVVIHNFHIPRARGTVRPFEANTPLVIDADAVLAFAASFQGLEPVSRQNGKVAERQGSFQPVQLQASGPFDAQKSLDAFPGREGLSFLVPETNDHDRSIPHKTPYVKHNTRRAAERATDEALRGLWCWASRSKKLLTTSAE